MSQTLIDLHETAAQWYTRRSEPGWTGADERALNAWLDESPEHREIYDGLALLSHDLFQIPLARQGAWRPQSAAATPSAAPAPTPTRSTSTSSWRDRLSAWRQRNWLPTAVAACAVLACVGGYGWQHWENQPTYQLDIATAPGEVRTLDLPDGSTVALNTNTHLTVRYSTRRRELALQSGEAWFSVAKDASRPFTVDSGASQVKVVGTVFDVRAAPQLMVKVSEGRVEVRPERDASQPQLFVLGPGAGLSVDPVRKQIRKLSTAAESVGDWRSGQLHFKRTPLAEVADELQRYLGQPIVVEGAELALQPISGVAATNNPRAFLQALPALLPLKVQQQGDGSWRIASIAK